jgi:hypothetical protein
MLSKTLIVNYLTNYLFEILSEDSPILLVNQVCLTLDSIIEIPSSSINLWPYKFLKYLHKNKSNSLSIIKSLILIKHNSVNQSSSEIFCIICQLLILISLCNYSHELFHKEINFPQWIVQAQHGMMLSNIYNYQLLFSTIHQKFVPSLFRKFNLFI